MEEYNNSPQNYNQWLDNSPSLQQKPNKKIWLLIIIPFLIGVIGLVLFYFLSYPKTISENEFSQGTTFELKENKEIKFTLDEEEHSIKVNSTNDNSVDLIIQSSPIQININIGEEKKFDLNNDGFFDIKIKLNSINKGIPDLYLKKIHESICTENWTCENWSSCSKGNQTRVCIDLTHCGTTKSKPSIIQSCVAVETCIEEWNCTNWSLCVSGNKTRTCIDSANCGTTKIKPSERDSCENIGECLTDANCNDGDSSTKDTCNTSEKCLHSIITNCVTGDNYCPINCDYSTDKDCEVTDSIKVECGENIWCYHDKVVELGNPDSCANINNYWNDVDQGVVGNCYYQIAINTRNCPLCERIIKQDIHNLCVREVC